MRSRSIGEINFMYFSVLPHQSRTTHSTKGFCFRYLIVPDGLTQTLFHFTPWYGCWNLDGVFPVPRIINIGAGHKSTVPWEISSWAADSAQTSGTGIVILNNRHHVSILLNIHWTTTLVQHQEKYCKDKGENLLIRIRYYELEFLENLHHDEGFGYSAINTARIALPVLFQNSYRTTGHGVTGWW